MKPSHTGYNSYSFRRRLRFFCIHVLKSPSNFSRSELLQEAYPGCSKYDYQTEMVGLAVIKYLPGLSDDVVYIHLFESLLS